MPDSRAAGFTLIELLTVIAIIGILAAILIPVVARVRDSARNAECLSNVRHWGQALLFYAEENNGVYHIRKDWDATLESDPGLGEGDSGTAGFGMAPWASATSDYNKYFLTLGQEAINYRRCPLEKGDMSAITYGIVWSTINGEQPSLERGVPVSVANDPSGLMMLVDTTTWSDTGHMAIEGARGAARGGDPVAGLARGDYMDRRHRGNMNAVFADGHVRSIHWHQTSPNDSDSFEAQWDRWTSIR